MAYQDSFPQSSLLDHLTRYFPRWMKLRKDPTSNGAQLLNTFALEFEEVEKILKETLDSHFISTANMDAVDVIWEADLDANGALTVIGVRDEVQYNLVEVNSVAEFFGDKNDIYIVDLEKQKLYTRIEYEQLLINEQVVYATPHNVWNSLDEMGMLFDTPRFIGERNTDYALRIQAVFRFLANASTNGLANGLARHLGLIRKEVWQDDSMPFFVVSTGIKPEFIRVDGYPVDQNTCQVTGNSARIMPLNQGTSHSVEYITGVQVNNLWDAGVQSHLYNTDGTASLRLIHIAEEIQRQAPTMWGEFRWDEGYWDTIDREMLGISYIPNIWDADVEKWRTLTFRGDKLVPKN